jgi:DNA-binding NarL/FixJ family response regulator
VAEWLKTSLKEHNLGLTGSQWQTLNYSLSEQQLQVLQAVQAGIAVEAIAKSLGIKTNQVVSEWSQIYLQAQELRNA